MPTIPERAYPLCVCTVLDGGVRRYTLQSATPPAVDAWLVHLSAWYHELEIGMDTSDRMRVLLDLRSAKTLPMAQISRVLPAWRSQYPAHRLSIAIVVPNKQMIGLAENLVDMMRMRREIHFFPPTGLENAHTWLNQQ